VDSIINACDKRPETGCSIFQEGQALKIRVSAQPEKGKSSSPVIALPADFFKIPARSIKVASGHTSRTKIIEIRGISDSELRENFSCLAS
jgi:uncharacterized protein